MKENILEAIGWLSIGIGCLTANLFWIAGGFICFYWSIKNKKDE